MSNNIEAFLASNFTLDWDNEINKISESIRQLLRTKLRKRGLIVAISGGIDSSVCAALAVQAVGPKRVFGLLMPEQDSSATSSGRGSLLAKHLGIEYEMQNIASTLESIGCYRWRNDAIKKTFPDYGEGWKNKIVIKGGQSGTINHFDLVVQDLQGKQYEKRLALSEYLTIVAATNYKQRIRKTIEFFHADRLNYAVVGTPNRVEYDQGFFVKNGDGSADLKPIAHLYKTQVYSLARHMGLPEEICSATPTTDTYSLAQGQDEFYYNLPYRQMDIALWCYNHNKPAAELAEVIGIGETEASYVYKDIEAKRRTTAPLHWQAIVLDKVDGPTTTPKN